MVKRTTLLVLFLASSIAWGQNKNAPGKPLGIRKAQGTIVLDGKLDEDDWKQADVAKDFFLNYPVDTALAPFQTEARVTFDDHHLYVSFVCYDDQTPDIVQSLRRDFEFDNNDNVNVILGPYNDGLNGFFFSLTPLGVQSEGTIASGGADGDSYNDTWDNKWFSKAVKYNDRWVAELSIPFKSFRYKSGLKEWNITFLRWDRKRNMASSWIATPIQFIPASFAYSGKLQWLDPSPAASTNISIIPFIAGGLSVDREANPIERTEDFQAGFDAKVGVTSSLNLDLTVNPDFSQVEVDRQVINLTRFEFQFPERRQFFLENSDLFSNIGSPFSRPFFSRRLGLARDTAGSIVRVPILYGARLSGSITKDWRISLLNMQTREQLKIGLPNQNFTVAAIQRNFWKQSNIQFSFVNKQSMGIEPGDSLKYFNKDLWREKNVEGQLKNVLNSYNRVAALDLEMRSANNTWYTSGFYGRSFDDFNATENQAGLIFVNHTKRNYNFFVGESFIQKNFNAEAGFVPAIGVYPGIFNTFANGGLVFYPKSKVIVSTGPVLDLSLSNTPDRTITDKSASLGYSIAFQNTASLQASYNYTYQRLTNSFNPIDSDRYTNFQEGDVYTWNNWQIEYMSNQRTLLRYVLGVSAGGFYNGSNTNINGELNYRYQPFGNVSVRFDYNDLRLPGNYGEEKLFLVGPRIDLTFTDKLFLTTFAQYNTLAENVNLNARFQWRYKPASDFFVVYTENYLPGTFSSKNRALVFKLTYWFNI
jgi:hypothetical protein